MPADYRVNIVRLAAPPAADQQTALLQKGSVLGYAPPTIALRDLPKQIEDRTLQSSLH